MPATLQISSVGIDERVRALGLNAQGQIYPPRRTTMWYTGSARRGQDGISVIAGHITYDGPDNFYNLVNVQVDGAVDITCASGRGVALRAVRTASVPKTTLQTNQTVWGSSATPVVVLITCDPHSPVVDGHHLNNYVVWTRPERSAPRRAG
ncbi:class F sortase [Leekyejoonella antrihumi]|uniref:class F sortase n=1 Tax=Leekyejoonella antrihumi TaxID=1660198 RepID=UPI0016467CA9|nr:class F sortase [Leekyejoonella antrihumi]